VKKVLVVNNEKNKDDLGWIRYIKSAIYSIEEVEFIIIHHSEVHANAIEKIKPDYIYLTGRANQDWTYEEALNDYATTIKMLQNTDIPTLGVCAGLQLIALAHNSSFGKMIEVGEDEEDIRETGFSKIEIKKDSYLFKGLENPFYCYQAHREEVKSVPERFNLLASSEMCKIQAIGHQDKKIYGVQFHPERYNENYLGGKKILKNFLNL